MTSLKKALQEKYKYKPYSKSFKTIFISEKRKILHALKKIKDKEVHHIGSTAVLGLGGKGIIDIIIVVQESALNRARRLLEQSGFLYDHTFEKKRAFFTKYKIDRKGKPRLVHLHLTFFGSGEKELALAFRDHLKSNKKDRANYIKIKKIAAKKHSHSPKEYRKYKNKHIKKILKNALKRKPQEN